MKKTTAGSSTSLAQIFGYALGEGAVSITMNGISNFAMLFYTQVLGLSAAYAGTALGITVLWDAITDPVMGHITDNTYSRFGRRFPYIFWGGIALAVSFFLLWTVPGRFSSPVLLFGCILVLNLFVRTAVTLFVIPYTALGFEICPEYTDRSRLQGIRYFINQTVNLIFGAFAWSLFFKDQVMTDGTCIDGTQVFGNYIKMGVTLSAVVIVMILLMIAATRKYAVDNRGVQVESGCLRGFFRDIAGVFKDPLARCVFGFFSIAQLAMLFTAQMQMFTYVHYMTFSSYEKTCVHGAGMVSFAIGALVLSQLVKQFDKKPTGYIGMVLSITGGLGLHLLFIGGFVDPQQTFLLGERMVPIAVIVFGVLQACWWGGCGILVPLALSMIADVSEINKIRTGVLKNGSYSAVFSFCLKAAVSVGLFITGWMVSGAGIVPGAELQPPTAARNIATLTFLCGPVLIILSFFILRMYPVDCSYIERLRKISKEGGSQ